MGINEYAVYASSDTGKTWQQLKSVKFEIASLAADTSGNIYVGGKNGLYMITAKGDTSYVGLADVVKNNTGIKSILIDKDNYIYAGTWGGVYKSTNLGKNWELLNNGFESITSDSNFTNPLPFGSYISAGMVDNYGNYIAGTDSAGVFISNDQGKSWEQTNLAYPCVTGIIRDSISLDYFASTLNNGLFKSTDNGQTWNTIYDGTSQREIYTLCFSLQKFPKNGTDSSSFSDERIILAGTDWGVYYSYNSMVMIWDPMGYVGSPVHAVAAFKSGNFVLCTVNEDVYLSSNFITQCTQQGSIDEQVSAIIRNGSDILFAAGNRGVYQSGDQGKTWVQINSGISDTNLISIAADKYGNILVGSKIGNIYILYNNQEHWTKIASLGYPVRCIFTDYADIVYASVADRFYKIPMKLSAVNNPDKKLLENIALNQNYPNPFNPSTIITYYLPESGKVAVIVYDVLGREVVKLYNGYQTYGNHELSFKASGLASGIYFYQLRVTDASGKNRNFVSTKKMIVLK